MLKWHYKITMHNGMNLIHIVDVNRNSQCLVLMIVHVIMSFELD